MQSIRDCPLRGSVEAVSLTYHRRQQLFVLGLLGLLEKGHRSAKPPEISLSRFRGPLVIWWILPNPGGYRFSLGGSQPIKRPCQMIVTQWQSTTRIREEAERPFLGTLRRALCTLRTFLRLKQMNTARSGASTRKFGARTPRPSDHC